MSTVSTSAIGTPSIRFAGSKTMPMPIARQLVEEFSGEFCVRNDIARFWFDAEREVVLIGESNCGFERMEEIVPRFVPGVVRMMAPHITGSRVPVHRVISPTPSGFRRFGQNGQSDEPISALDRVRMNQVEGSRKRGDGDLPLRARLAISASVAGSI